jgi:hypothetical protein
MSGLLGSDLFVQVLNGSSLLIPGNSYNVNSQPGNYLPLFGSGIIPVSVQIDPETPISLKWFVNAAPATAYYLHFSIFTARILLHDVIAHELREMPIMFQKLIKNLVLKGG